MHNEYRVTVDNQEYDVWRDDVYRINKQTTHTGRTKRWHWQLKPEHEAEEIARVKVALRAQYEEKAAKVTTMRLSTLRAQILKESKQPWLVGYDTYLRRCYGLQIDVAAGVVWQLGDHPRYAIGLASYWRTRIAHAREMTLPE